MNSFWIILMVAIPTQVVLGVTEICENPFVCLTDRSFAFCFLVDGSERRVGNYTCSPGTQCTEDPAYPCQQITTTATTLATSQPVLFNSYSATVQTCDVGSVCKYAALDCGQYYELTQRSCPVGESFSTTESQCVSDSTCNGGVVTIPELTTERPQQTTTQAAVTIPTCTSPSRYPCPVKNKYYECVETNDGSYQLVVNTCGEGEVFDESDLQCVGDTDASDENEDTLTTSISVTPPTCTSPSRYPCPAEHQYYECLETGEGSYELVVRTCPSGEIFDTATLNCIAIVVSNPTTTIASVTIPTCTSPSRYPCPAKNQYYECLETEEGSYELIVGTCSSGEIFDADSLECVQEIVTISTTTTTTVAPVTLPTCTSPSRYPCPANNKYYECVEKGGGSYQLVVRSCLSGEIFDSATLECVSEDTVSETVTTSTTTIKPVTHPTCTSPSKYAAPVNNKYYECVETGNGSYQLVVRSCDVGQIFDSVTLECINESDNSSSGEDETTLATTIASDELPVCIIAGRLSCICQLQCNQYYECIESDDGSYKAVLRTCPSGESFNTSALECIPDDSCIADLSQSTTIVTDESPASSTIETSFTASSSTAIPSTETTGIPIICNAIGNLPCDLQCNQYYECVLTDDGSVQAVLKTCPSGQAFDDTILECSSDVICVIEITETTSTTETTLSTSTSTTTEVTDAPPTCVISGKLSCICNLKCNEYYECVEVDNGSFEAVLRTCAIGEAFSNSSLECIPDQRCIATEISTASTREVSSTASSVTTEISETSSPLSSSLSVGTTSGIPIVCTAIGNLHCDLQCNQYYECVLTEGGSFEAVLKTCPSGQAFDNEILECSSDVVCVVDTTETTSATETSSSTSLSTTEITDTSLTTSSPDYTLSTGTTTGNPVICRAVGNLPCDIQCNQYYECVQTDDGQFESVLKTCPSGEAFDSASLECSPDVSCVLDASTTPATSEITSRSSGTGITTETSDISSSTEGSSSETTAAPPTCVIAGKLTCICDLQCNQYYECVKSDDGSFEAELKTCPSGEAFSNSSLECFPDENCVATETSTALTSERSSVVSSLTTESSLTSSYSGSTLSTETTTEVISITATNEVSSISSATELTTDTSLTSSLTDSTFSTGTTSGTPVICRAVGNLPCDLQCNQYYECVQTDDGVFESVLKTCPSGEAFDTTSVECSPDVNCVLDASTTPATSEIISETSVISSSTEGSSSETTAAPPTCVIAGKLTCICDLQCNQYYECVKSDDGSFEAVLKTCPSGDAFSNSSLECIPDENCVATETSTALTSESSSVVSSLITESSSTPLSLRTIPLTVSPGNLSENEPSITESTTDPTTSTTEAPVTAPESCTNASKYPAQNCNQYYECVSTLWWFNLETKSCASGEAFSTTESACIANSSCDATTGEFITAVTVTTDITTTTESAVTAPAACNSAGKYPAQNCNQYYECVAFLWWFNLEVKSCNSGQAFNSSSLTCVTSTTCNAVATS